MVLRKLAGFLQNWILGPTAQWNFVSTLVNVNKSFVLDSGFQSVDCVEWLVDLGTDTVEEWSPGGREGVLWQSSVVGMEAMLK